MKISNSMSQILNSIQSDHPEHTDSYIPCQNVDADLLWLRLLAKYLMNECNMTISKAHSCIFYNNVDDGKLELVISVHVDDVFMAGRPET